MLRNSDPPGNVAHRLRAGLNEDNEPDRASIIGY